MWTRLKTFTRQLRSSRQQGKSDTASAGMIDPQQADIRVLMVCMGNICRSPLAEAVLRKGAAEYRRDWTVYVDSAGTHSYHVGSPPDPRAQAAAARREMPIDDLQARRVQAADFEIFDLILAMDQDNLDFLRELAPEGLEHKARLLLEFSALRTGGEVPDPYYGGATGFERVLDMVEEAILQGLLPELHRRVDGAGQD